MKKLKIIFLIITIMFSEKVLACDENLNLALANNVLYSYEFIEQNDYSYFKITFSNLKNGLYIKDQNQISYNNDDLTLSYYQPGKTYTFYVYSNDYSCPYDYIRIINIKLPKYNEFYRYITCQNKQDFEFCNKWYQGTLNEKKFKEGIKKYEESKNKKEEIVEESLLHKISSYLLNIYTKYYYIILPLLIIGLIIVIYKLDQKNNIL